MAKRQISKAKTFFCSIFSILIGLVVGFVLNIYLLTPNSFEIPETVTTTNASVAISKTKTTPMVFHGIVLKKRDFVS